MALQPQADFLASLGGSVDAEFADISAAVQEQVAAAFGAPAGPDTLVPPILEPLLPYGAAPVLRASADPKVAAVQGEEEQTKYLQAKLERIKVETMHAMVKSVEFVHNGAQVKSSVLYLTNAQAATIKQEKMPLVRRRLGITDPKMVICLMPSRCSAGYWKAFPHMHDSSKNDGRFFFRGVPEVREADKAMTEHQLVLLVKDVLLPLAMRTQALIVGTDACALMNAFVQVSAPVQRRLGQRCPFRLLLFARAYWFHLNAEQPGTISNRFRAFIPTWAERSDDRDGSLCVGLKQMYGDDPAFWPHADLTVGDYSLVMFECLNDAMDRLSSDNAHIFQNSFVDSLAEFLPVIAVQTFGTPRLHVAPHMAEHVSRGLPLLLLDSRYRQKQKSPAHMDELAEAMQATAMEIHEMREGGGVCDFYTTSLLSFVRSTVDKILQQRNQEQGASKSFWIWQVVDESLSTTPLQRSVSVGNMEEGACGRPGFSDFRNRVLSQATDLVMEYIGADNEWESRRMSARFQEGLERTMQASDWSEFAKVLDENWLRLKGCVFFKHQAAEAFSKENLWCKFKDSAVSSAQGRRKLVIDLDYPDKPPLAEAQRKLSELLTREFEEEHVKYDAVTKTAKAFKAKDHIWFAIFELMKAQNVYTGSLFDLDGVKRTLERLAQSERLPERNTMEGTLLIRRAWVLFDLFNHTADFYKYMCKLSYLLALLLGIAIVVVTVFANMYPDDFEEQRSRNVRLGLSLSTTVVTAITTAVDPARKWLQLRGNAMMLESEIWKFRTRTGAYAGSTAAAEQLTRNLGERSAERAFVATLTEVEERVQACAGLSETSFFAATTSTDDAGLSDGRSGARARLRQATAPIGKPPKYCRHGQYKDSGTEALRGPGSDDFHSPATASDYIKLRLVPCMAFYQRRIPRYSLKRRFFQVILVLSSIVTALLAALHEPNWTAIIASITAATASWQEFAGTDKKLQRYSAIVATLSTTLMRWQSLPEVDQSNMHRVAELVDRTEQLVSREHAAWLSDATRSIEGAVAKTK